MRFLFSCLGLAPIACGAFVSAIVLASETVSLAADGWMPTGDPPRSPQQTIAVTHVREGFEIQLIAAEPLVQDPVAIAWGADGRLWVAEMADYPLGIDGNGTPGGRIRVLQDSNGDGQYDQSTIFLSNVRFPTGVMPWRDGVLITAAPDIILATDRDGDGHADHQEVLLSNFQAGNQQLRVNGLRWGLDNWVYCASGAHHAGYGAKRKIRSIKSGQEIQLGSRDFRFRPDSGEIDPQSGPSQFGRNRDDWGNWFGVQNSYPLWHFVLADHYLRRNPHFAPPDPRNQLIQPRNPRVFPAKDPQKRFHHFEQSGRFTSACSSIVYRDQTLIPRDDQTSHAFTCEPFHNLIQHNLLICDGVSFRSKRDPAESTLDFFASQDRWCRPVMARTGPDGALWVVDMYRYMIEHPEWLTPQGRTELRPYYRSGENLGRIYRVVRRDQNVCSIPNLASQSTEQLVTALGNPNGPQRDLATQELIWRDDRAAIPLLQQLVIESTRPLARLHGLCALDGLAALSPAIVARGLSDPHAGIRRQAIRLAESFADHDEQVLKRLIELRDDPDPSLRLQLICSLGQLTDARAATTLAGLTTEFGKDAYFDAALLSSIQPRNLPILIRSVLNKALLSREDFDPSEKLVAQLLDISIAWNEKAGVTEIIKQIVDRTPTNGFVGQARYLAVLFQSLNRQNQTLAGCLSSEKKSPEELLNRISTITRQARSSLPDSSAELSSRIAAVDLLGWETNHRADDLMQMVNLLKPQTSPAIQSAIVNQLGRFSDPTIGKWLLDGWRGHSPSLRSQIVVTLASRGAWMPELLDAIETGRVRATDLDASEREYLSRYHDQSIRERLHQALADSHNDDRQQVLRQSQSVLQLTGDPSTGQSLFRKHCSGCHRLAGYGYEVGPNLASITDRQPLSLLTAILDPSAVVDGKYASYTALTTDGRLLAGMVMTETSNSITLVSQNNVQQVVLRTELEELRSTGKSLMPDGIENDLTHQQLADLIAYIRQQRS